MHEPIDPDEAITAFARFHAENPEYEATRPLDELRMNDFARLATSSASGAGRCSSTASTEAQLAALVPTAARAVAGR